MKCTLANIISKKNSQKHQGNRKVWSHIRDNYYSHELRKDKKYIKLNVRNEMCCRNSSNRYETQELFNKEILVVFVYLFISTYFKSDVFFFKLGKQERHRNKILLINVL